MRSSSTRSGRSSSRSRSTATPTTRPTTNHGDWWDHVALDPESRLVLAVVPGARDAEAVEEVVDEVKRADRRAGCSTW